MKEGSKDCRTTHARATSTWSLELKQNKTGLARAVPVSVADVEAVVRKQLRLNGTPTHTTFKFHLQTHIKFSKNLSNLFRVCVTNQNLAIAPLCWPDKIRSPCLFYLLTAGVEVVYLHLITLRHTPQSVGLLWSRDWPLRRDLYLTTQTLYKRQTSVPPVGSESTIPAKARPQTYALDRAATGIGPDKINHPDYDVFFSKPWPWAVRPVAAVGHRVIQGSLARQWAGRKDTNSLKRNRFEPRIPPTQCVR
jgi:hypothetical protein